ncbi:hypothetical protein CHS0354_033764 [Potamilus streckersoni]|uniref:Toll-like receptor 5 n=1 Tax=Potamilus streckersoni TaxID=2493646 RepID=A0AAE0S2K2_9BIVA|nr:hypothetical protein CHS0354_033764 [Potamilus streckersoni]
MALIRGVFCCVIRCMVLGKLFIVGVLMLLPVQGFNGGKYLHCDLNITHVICKEEELGENLSIVLEGYLENTGTYHELQYIELTGNNIVTNGSRELPPNLFGNCSADPKYRLSNLKTLDLSNNSIETIHGKTFHCMPKLENLTLRDNKWKLYMHSDQTGYFSNLHSLKALDLSNAFEDMWDGSYHLPKLVEVFKSNNLAELRTLNLSYNEFMAFSDEAGKSLCTLPSLQTLDLSYNYISRISLYTCLNTTTIDLSNNKIPQLLPDFISNITKISHHANFTIYFKNNEWECDCYFKDTYRFFLSVDSAFIKDLEDLVCVQGFHSSYVGRPVKSLNEEDFKCYFPNNEERLKAPYAVMGVLFGLIGIAFITGMYIKRKKMKKLCTGCRASVKLSRLATHSNVGYSSVSHVSHV